VSGAREMIQVAISWIKVVHDDQLYQGQKGQIEREKNTCCFLSKISSFLDVNIYQYALKLYQ
jgi:hypothetical protein